MSVMRLPILLLAVLLLVSASVAHGGQEGPPDVKIALKAADPDLLLFWDEKDLYVQTATRSEKHISTVAENMIVVMAKDIEAMNAHSVAEVLRNVPGLYVDLQTGLNFGSTSQIQIQGSEPRHVLVLVDGLAWNFLVEGAAETTTIPVGIIDRIEIIKGPASSAWGSALGGVINILTKEPVDKSRPSGILSASYGQHSTQDFNAQVSAENGPFGYYLYAGHQGNDGLKSIKDYKNNSLYAKLKYRPSNRTTINLSLGYSKPETRPDDIPDLDVSNKMLIRNTNAALNVEHLIAGGWRLDFVLSSLRHKSNVNTDVLGMGMLGAAGDLFKRYMADEKTDTASIRLGYGKGMHSATLGIEASKATLEATTNVGPLYQLYGVAPSMTSKQDLNKWAVFLNDSLYMDKFTITPGIRFDHNNISGDFVSPSLGATYKFSEHTIARVSAARGFTLPPLGWTSGGGIFFDPNPDLKAERVWSYQAGLEANIADLIWMRATAFYHDMKDEITKVREANKPPFSTMINAGDVKRKGAELEIESVPLYHMTLKLGASYTHRDPSAGDAKDFSQYLVALRYDDKVGTVAQLTGARIGWGINDPAYNAEYNSFIWDLSAKKRFYTMGDTSLEAFLTVHNLFDGTYNTMSFYPSPGRWAEAGVKVRF